MTTLELTPESAGWVELIAERIAAGDLVEVRIDTPALSPAEFGARMGLSRTAVINWIERGKLKAEKRGTYWRIPVAEVERFRRWYLTHMAADLAEDI